MATIVINMYRRPACLFVGGESILSSEGTTQADRIAIPMYALGIVPLMPSVTTTGTVKPWFADDSAAGGKLQRVHEWWGGLANRGPSYGYHVNTLKSALLVKLAFYDQATELFADT